ncbi:MAG: SusE domain-containing protein [Bacteroidota bacterium]
MKNIFKYLFFASLFAGIATGCEKTEVLPFYKSGTAPSLSSSTSTIAAIPADSSKSIITFSWTNPAYAADSATSKYVLQMDTTGGNFAKATSRTVVGTTSTSYTAKEINDIMLGYGFTHGKTYGVDVRVISSYGNNNDQLASNTIKLQVTPYKIPPKIPVPAELIIVGSATIGDWSNPAPTAAQEVAQKFALIDETTYAGIFYLNGGKQYLMLPETGKWDHKFGGTSKTGGELLVDGAVPGSNTPAPDASGWYKIVVDFQTGFYTVTPVANEVPMNLYGIGDATVAQWDNTAVGGQSIARKNSIWFEGDLPLSGGKNLKFISTLGQWQPQFGKGDSDGLLGANYGGGSDPNTISIATDGTYKIKVDFLTNTYTVVKQ